MNLPNEILDNIICFLIYDFKRDYSKLKNLFNFALVSKNFYNLVISRQEIEWKTFLFKNEYNEKNIFKKILNIEKILQNEKDQNGYSQLCISFNNELIQKIKIFQFLIQMFSCKDEKKTFWILKPETFYNIIEPLLFDFFKKTNKIEKKNQLYSKKIVQCQSNQDLSKSNLYPTAIHIIKIQEINQYNKCTCISTWSNIMNEDLRKFIKEPETLLKEKRKREKNMYGFDIETNGKKYFDRIFFESFEIFSQYVCHETKTIEFETPWWYILNNNKEKTQLEFFQKAFLKTDFRFLL